MIKSARNVFEGTCDVPLYHLQIYIVVIFESHIYAGWSPPKDNPVEQTGNRGGQDRLLKV